ncbi:hypothetical protein amrb99_98400 [Actinomadura sp. RB99]|uniref:hypothetical protein n=1 Tax=Actinomadura sp. RB99 TaxID=2691577 RepID=UPI001682DD90|nr:hypothetical protein [Actinomadura sp. RB99]MBD2900830.1 hypothetical protein [Actinomadura sp. RB99]
MMPLPPDPIPLGQDAAARIETKLDVLLAQHGHVAAQVSDHEIRLRAVEAGATRADTRISDLTARDGDKETRLRAADRWRYALPITAAGGLLGGAAAIITALK